jgi:hypothetical protein
MERQKREAAREKRRAAAAAASAKLEAMGGACFSLFEICTTTTC